MPRRRVNELNYRVGSLRHFPLVWTPLTEDEMASSLGSRQYQGNGVRPYIVLHPDRAAGPGNRAFRGHKLRTPIGVRVFTTHDRRGLSGGERVRHE